MRSLVLAFVLVLGWTGAVAADGYAEPAPQTTRKVEILRERPSGFWTSNRPATNGAYRWRLLAIGVVLAGGAGYLMWRLTRRANAERVARERGVAATME